jgi:hypothetical protein
MSIGTRSLALGAAITSALLALAVSLGAVGYASAARAVFWPNSLLQALIPRFNMGTLEHPFYEGTPLNLFAFIASIPLAFVIYSLAAYAYLRWRQRGT